MSSHTNEMIERVARAICKGRGRNPDECVQGHGWSGANGSGSVCSLRAWQTFFSDARAAIEALREPTRAMVEAASTGFGIEPSFGDAEYPHEHYLQRSRNSFTAAIDAALQEKQG